MKLTVEDHFSEYYIVNVEEERYKWNEASGAHEYALWQTIDEWCEATWGEQGIWGGPAGQWKRLGPKYYFSTEGEVSMFLLRWDNERT